MANGLYKQRQEEALGRSVGGSLGALAGGVSASTRRGRLEDEILTLKAESSGPDGTPLISTNRFKTLLDIIYRRHNATPGRRYDQDLQLWDRDWRETKKREDAITFARQRYPSVEIPEAIPAQAEPLQGLSARERAGVPLSPEQYTTLEGVGAIRERLRGAEGLRREQAISLEAERERQRGIAEILGPAAAVEADLAQAKTQAQYDAALVKQRAADRKFYSDLVFRTAEEARKQAAEERAISAEARDERESASRQNIALKRLRLEEQRVENLIGKKPAWLEKLEFVQKRLAENPNLRSLPEEQLWALVGLTRSDDPEYDAMVKQLPYNPEFGTWTAAEMAEVLLNMKEALRNARGTSAPYDWGALREAGK